MNKFLDLNLDDHTVLTELAGSDEDHQDLTYLKIFINKLISRRYDFLCKLTHLKSILLFLDIF